MLYVAIPWHSIELLALYAFAYAFTIVAGCYVVAFILRRFPVSGEGGMKHAGLVIGILERIFVLTRVLYGQFTAIMLVLTAKSIARFEDVKKREFAEYYLIGTFTSMLCALFVGLATVWFVAQ